MLMAMKMSWRMFRFMEKTLSVNLKILSWMIIKKNLTLWQMGTGTGLRCDVS
jgi:hypothetical protein